MIDESLLKVVTYNGIGYQPLIDFESWRVAILRYHEELLPQNITQMQRHDETDEVFVLLEGRCILLIGEGTDQVERIHAVDMLPNQIYNVKRGCWHSHTLSSDARVLIVENRDTNDFNSPKSNLSSQQCDFIIEETKSIERGLKNMNEIIKFPENFLWGAATSSYQIEGGWNADGKGESIWDRFSHTPGKIKNGDTGDVAIDHYHRFREDVALMSDLGLQAYRFSIAWPRILPQGRGKILQAGIDFYNRLVDELLNANIIPFATLYHWDLPQALQDEGGWTVRSTAEAFTEYTDVITRALGDRVKNWMTHNEMSVVYINGYVSGEHAPGKKNDYIGAVRTGHHLLISHGWSIPIIRQNSPGCEVGPVINANYNQLGSNSKADRMASNFGDGIWIRWVLDALYGRGYPADVMHQLQTKGMVPVEKWDFIQPGDMDVIATKTDFVGLNYYFRHIARDEEIPEEENEPQTVFSLPKDDINWTEMGWEVYPDGLRHVLARFYFEYQVPKIYITENGASYSDSPGPDGRVRDDRRIRYLNEHFHAAHQAIQMGVPLAGYFVWSLFDNFEWGHGNSQRFGLIWSDYETQKRIWKDSAFWYQNIIRQNGIEE